MNIENDYLKLLKDILENGKEKEDRTGTGTISVFGRQIRHDMSEGFPLLTTKQMYWKGIVTELIWFLRGDTNIKYLVENGCNIWNGDAYKKYEQSLKRSIDRATKEGILQESDDYNVLSKESFIERIKTDNEFANKWGELGPIYGKQWRNWNGIDQIESLIENLKTNPDSRRLMVSAWNVGELDQMTLPPCHYGFQVYTRKLTIKERKAEYFKRGYTPNIDPLDYVPERAISLMWNQRSVDTFLGLPFNIASYGLLLEIIAKAVNMVPDELIGNLGDVHLYKNHIDQAKEQLTREPKLLPTLKHLRSDDKYMLLNEFSTLLSEFKISDFEVIDYQSHPTIKAPLSN